MRATLPLALLAACTPDAVIEAPLSALRTFRVEVTQVQPTALRALGGDPDGELVVLSPLVYAVHAPRAQLLVPGSPPDAALAALAIDGDPAPLAASMALRVGVSSAGVVDTPVGGTGPGPLGPGDAYVFEIRARRDERVALATALRDDKPGDRFLALQAVGSAGLFPTPDPPPRDLSRQLWVWDAGISDEDSGGGVTRVVATADEAALHSVVRVTVTPL